MRARLAGIVAAALALVPLAAAADDRADALKLAQRLAEPGGMGTAIVTLHELPARFPGSIPLPRATLLGSVAHAAPKVRSSSGSGVSVSYSGSLSLYYVSPNRDATVKAYEDALRAAGWKHADLAERFPFQRGGFGTQFPRYDAWCSSGAAQAAVTIRTVADDATALDIGVLEPAPGVGMICNPQQSPFQDFLRPSPLPPFTAPPGITIENSGNLGGDGSTSAARLTSSLGLGPVFESFAKQMRDAGWTPKSASSAAGLQSQTFTKTIDGTPYVTLLTIYALDATHYVALADASNVTV